MQKWYIYRHQHTFERVSLHFNVCMKKKNIITTIIDHDRWTTKAMVINNYLKQMNVPIHKWCIVVTYSTSIQWDRISFARNFRAHIIIITSKMWITCYLYYDMCRLTKNDYRSLMTLLLQFNISNVNYNVWIISVLIILYILFLFRFLCEWMLYHQR